MSQGLPTPRHSRHAASKITREPRDFLIAVP